MRFPVSLSVSLLLATLLAPPTALAQPASEPTPAPFKASAPLSLELKNVQWFDGQGFSKRGTLYVVDGKFVASKPARVNRRMDLKNQFMIPPLGEAHNYNLQSDWGLARYAQRYIADGVFYAAMLCADPAEMAQVKPKLDGEDSPDVIFASACISASDGQPMLSLLAASKARVQDLADKAVIVMDRPEQVEQKWKALMARKPDLVRIAFSYSEKSKDGKGNLREDTAAAIVRQAHASGLKVTAQIDSAADFEAALRAGVDQIAHLPGYFNHNGDGPERFVITPEAAAQAARQKVSVITGTAATTLFKTTPEQLEALRQTQTRNLRTLKEAGVPLLLGSDVFTGTAAQELQHLDGFDVYSNTELLKMATVDTPRALFPKRKLGCFEPGCEASFLLLAANPIDDLKAVAMPLLRVKSGRILTQNEDVAEAADATSESTAGAPAKKGGSKAKPNTTKKPAAKPKQPAKPKAAPAKKS